MKSTSADAASTQAVSPELISGMSLLPCIHLLGGAYRGNVTNMFRARDRWITLIIRRRERAAPRQHGTTAHSQDRDRRPLTAPRACILPAQKNAAIRSSRRPDQRAGGRCKPATCAELAGERRR